MFLLDIYLLILPFLNAPQNNSFHGQSANPKGIFWHDKRIKNTRKTHAVRFEHRKSTVRAHGAFIPNHGDF
jgi:hypothetical protein